MKLSSRKLQRTRRVDLNMTSMIDVVFLLLIFFMVTTSFVKAERQIDSAIKVKNRSASEASRLEPAIVDIARGAGGSFVFKLGAREISSQEELTRILGQFENKVDGAFVRVADDAPFGLAAAAIQACKSAGFVTVSYVPLDR